MKKPPAGPGAESGKVGGEKDNPLFTWMICKGDIHADDALFRIM